MNIYDYRWEVVVNWYHKFIKTSKLNNCEFLLYDDEIFNIGGLEISDTELYIKTDNFTYVLYNNDREYDEGAYWKISEIKERLSRIKLVQTIIIR